MYNKVEYNGETLIDLTDTTAEESDVLQGKQFHDRSGALREGNFVPQSYTAGAGIDITNDKISVKVDDDTIQTNTSGQLEVNEDKIASKDYVDTEIETIEYNDIFNIRVEWDREYMPHFELIKIYYQYYESGRLAEDTVSYNVKDITNGDVYLYKNTGDSWQIAVGTEPSSYGRLPMLVGNIATKTVNGESVKLFFRNGDDETQFDELNNNKANKQTWSTLLTATTTEDAVFQLDDTSVGVDLNSYNEIQVIFELPSRVTAFLYNFWKYNDAYTTRVLGSFSSMEMQYIVVKVKKEYGIWWIENTIGIQYDRLAQHWKQVYRKGTGLYTSFVFKSFEGMRFALSTTSVIPSGTKIQVRGYK